MDIIKETDYENKPIAYINVFTNKFITNNMDMKSVIEWGATAFYERGTETTKFINNFGYNFLIISRQEYEEAIKQYEMLDEEEKKDKNIIELEDYIIVNFEKY